MDAYGRCYKCGELKNVDTLIKVKICDSREMHTTYDNQIIRTPHEDYLCVKCKQEIDGGE